LKPTHRRKLRVYRKVVEEARLYNPIVHEVTIRVSRDKGSCGN